MGFDLRLPIGLMFTVFGSLLVIFGLITSGSDMYQQRSLGININLWWGAVLLVFGLLILLLAWSAANKKTTKS